MTDSRLPSDSIAKMICLPAVATLQGVSLVTPPQKVHHPILLTLLQALGGFVECETQHQMNAMMVPTGMMGSMYGLLRTNRDWLVKQGVNPKDASYFVAQQYSSMMQDALNDDDNKDNDDNTGGNHYNPQRFDDLVEEQTPGGLNEQALQNLEQQGVWGAYENVMDALLDRLEGRSDGSLRK
jgi:pyrroline-5-carboxylate reductase